jgi:hypothetical protein
MTKQLLINSIICNNCFEKITSRYRHDYQTCKCGSVSIDGGLEYRKFNGTDFIDAAIYNTDLHEKIRLSFKWGSFGKDGNESLKYIKLCDMSLSHIGAILETQKLKPEFVKVFTDEFNFRSIR